MTDTNTAALARIRQMADCWEQHLPEVIRTPAVVSALRAALESAAPVSSPPADQAAGDVRDQLLHALDFSACLNAGYGGPEELLAAYDASRTPSTTDRIAEAALAAVEAALGDTLVPAAREEALAGIVAVLPEPADRAAVLAEDLRYVLNYRGPGHDHERPGFWDTSGDPCTHCARLAVARRNLAAHDDELRRMADETPATEETR